MNEENNKLEFQHTYCCDHCLIPFFTNLDQDPSGSSSQQLLTNVLSTIFKLNYLKVFDTFDEDEEELSLCPTCSELLSNLYRIYNDFVELGKINSYLSRKLDRMNEIMDSHAQRRIHCDLIDGINHNSPASINTDSHFSQSVSPSATYNLNRLQSNSIISNNNNSNLCPRSSEARRTINFDREPRIMLKRLPKNYSHLLKDNTTVETLAAVKDEETDDDYNSLSDDDYIPSGEEYVQESTEFADAEDSNEKSCRRIKNKKVKTTTASVSKRVRSSSSPKKKKREGLGSTTTTTKSKNKSTKTKNNKNSSPTLSKKGRKTRNKDVESCNEKRTEEMSTPKVRSCQIKMSSTHYNQKRFSHPNPCWYCKRTDFLTPAECFEHTKQEHLPICDADDDTCVKLCERCSKICFTESGFRHHLSKCSLIPPGECLPKTHPCDQCSLSFGTEDLLRIHQISHNTDRPFPCTECSFRGKTATAIKKHVDNVHPDPHKQLLARVRCDECGKFYSNKFVLKKHKTSVHSTTVEQKEKYKQSLKRQVALMREKRKRMPEVKRTTVCTDCGIDFFSRPGFLHHRRTFHGEVQGDFVCDTCGKVFSSTKGLQKHSLVHTDERPFLCQECGKGYKTADCLHRHHTNSHTTEGRLKYNEKMRERNRRRKFLQQQIAARGLLKAQFQTGIEEDMEFVQ